MIYQKIFRIKSKFVDIALLFAVGILLVFLTPPLQIPDEPNHFYRVFQISEGKLISPAKEFFDVNGSKIYFYAEVPETFLELERIGARPHGIIDGINYWDFNSIKETLSLPLDAQIKDMGIPNTGSYSPLVYAPQALFAFLARIIFGTLGAVFYASRLGAVLFTAVCILTSIRLLPEKRFLILAVAFMPMFLFEMASCSADAVIYSVAILSTAYFFSLSKTDAPISARQIFFLTLAAISLGLAKSVYGTILILYLLIPSKRFGSKLKFYGFGIFLLAVFLISSLGWLHFSKSGLPVLPYMNPIEGVDMNGQIETIKNNPSIFFSALLNNIVSSGEVYFKSFIGILGWHRLDLPMLFYVIYSAVLIFGGLIGNLKLKISHRVLMIFATLPTFLVTFLYSYITWTPVGSDNIQGIQGRYFIPLAFMILAALSHFENYRHENKIIFAVILISASLTIWEVFKNFY